MDSPGLDVASTRGSESAHARILKLALPRLSPVVIHEPSHPLPSRHSRPTAASSCSTCALPRRLRRRRRSSSSLHRLRLLLRRAAEAARAGAPQRSEGRRHRGRGVGARGRRCPRWRRDGGCCSRRSGRGQDDLCKLLADKLAHNGRELGRVLRDGGRHGARLGEGLLCAVDASSVCQHRDGREPETQSLAAKDARSRSRQTLARTTRPVRPRPCDARACRALSRPCSRAGRCGSVSRGGRPVTRGRRTRLRASSRSG